MSTATSATQYSECSEPSCYGIRLAGAPLSCPRCGSTKLRYPSPTRAPMPAAALTARALQRAHDERVHIFAIPGRPGCYTTKSKRDPSERYYLALLDGELACSCKGFLYRRCCKHVEALRNRLARESRRSAQSTQAVA